MKPCEKFSANSFQPAELRRELHTKQFAFSTVQYPFLEALERLFGCSLGEIHNYLGSFDRFQRNNDQSTLAHKVFYSNFHTIIMPIYEQFMKNEMTRILYPHKFYYQLIPTFRIGLPGNTFVGEYHKDSKYNHQDYEVNFNLGLANYEGKSALRTEVSPGKDEWITLESPYGKIFSFDHIDCLHGSDPNDSDKTMVSFDFRLALYDLYYESDASSVNMTTQFRPGSYFSSKAI